MRASFIAAFVGEDGAEGSYPTPKSPIKGRNEKQADGIVKSTVELPDGIERIE